MYNLPVQTVELTRENWQALLHSQGRSKVWLARETGTASNTVYSYSSGRRRPTPDWLRRAANAMGVPLGPIA